jgi:hypothetical protein
MNFPAIQMKRILQKFFTGIDLDVPGSELDDTQEDLGSEDEENNYYSIGGDNHDDLEERKEDTLKRD